MDRFESLVKPTDPFSENCTYMHKIKYLDIESISMCYDLYYITKETNYAQVQFS